MIEERTVHAATCDACGEVRYSEKDTIPGCTVTVIEVAADGTTEEYQIFACRRTHISKAIKAVNENDTYTADLAVDEVDDAEVSGMEGAAVAGQPELMSA